MPAKYQRAFLRALSRWDQDYDPNVQMIRRPFSSPGYHTTLKGGFVHPTRDSLVYALALLDRGDVSRAESVIGKVISLQDADPEHDTYGLWSWFYEEPLEKMSPPDWNWADFCGQELLVIFLEHAGVLSPEKQEKIRNAIFRAADSILRRDVSPNYTNIALMGAFVTLAAGEFFGEKRYFNYGQTCLARVCQQTQAAGSFAEYNSPTYTMVALDELARLRNYVRDPASRRSIESLYKLAWLIVAKHFHAPTRQWAGPYSRAYGNIQSAEFSSRLQLATGISFVEEPTLNLYCPRVDWSCPGELRPYFQALEAPRTERVLVSMQERQVATTRLEEKFALGSFAKAALWNQTRGLVAHWQGSQGPAYLQLRALHDGYDYCSAVLHSVQSGGSVLGVVNFATDGGDAHPNLDMVRQGTITARDFKLRFEFSDPEIELPLTVKEGELVTFNLGETELELGIAQARFGQLPVSLETGKDQQRAWLDLVFYRGAARKLDFRALCAYAVFALQLHQAGQGRLEPVQIQSSPQLAVSWRTGGETLQLRANGHACSMAELWGEEPGLVGGKSVLALAAPDFSEEEHDSCR